MQWMTRLLLLALVALVGAGGWGPGRVDQFMRIAADQVDPALPDQPLGLWMNRQLPPGAVVRTSIEACDAAPGDCLVIDADIVSRARRLVLTFDLETNTFVGGTLGAPDMEPMPPITSLAELPRRMTAPIRPFPLDCPEGTQLRLEEEYAGLREWCEDGAGVKRGPARAWFSTGRYLMYKGGYVAGERDGRWLECDRFERCKVRVYP